MPFGLDTKSVVVGVLVGAFVVPMVMSAMANHRGRLTRNTATA